MSTGTHILTLSETKNPSWLGFAPISFVSGVSECFPRKQIKDRNWDLTDTHRPLEGKEILFILTWAVFQFLHWFKINIWLGLCSRSSATYSVSCVFIDQTKIDIAMQRCSYLFLLFRFERSHQKKCATWLKICRLCSQAGEIKTVMFFQPSSISSHFCLLSL